jgi:squalene-hopene/tetraprenyl-beta-curcumene cyclase
MVGARPRRLAKGDFDMRRAITIALLLSATTKIYGEDKRASDISSTINRGVGFLAKDAIAWREKQHCVSCHHAGLIVWALREAKQHGHDVDDETLAELTAWIAGSGSGKTGLPRPAGIPKALNTAAVYFGLALGADTAPDKNSRNALTRFSKTMIGDQTDNGSWSFWPNTRPPISGNSDEAITTLATLALMAEAASGDQSAKAVRDKGVKRLAETKSDDDPQSIAIRLVLWTRLGRPTAEWAPLVESIKARQRPDGGWSQTKDMQSDAWATGQALYALAHAGIKTDDPVIGRAHAFLIKTQRDDGSWPMTVSSFFIPA